MYLLFCGVRDYERLLAAILSTSDSDVLYAPGLLGVELTEEGQEDVFYDNPVIQDMDDDPEGFWCSEVVDEGEFLDKVESSMRHYPGKGRMRSTRR